MFGSIAALNALNFFMADVRDGLGPFLGVYLQEQGWSPGEIGLVMTIGGLAGMAATTPLGMLVDSTKAKRAVMVSAACIIIAASFLMLIAPGFGWVAASQVATGIAAAAVAPAIAGITLGLVAQRGYPFQLGRNEAFFHAGNVAAALAAGVFGYLFGLTAVFFVMAAMAVGAIVSTLLIDPRKIDHVEARGAVRSESGEAKQGFSVLYASKPLLVLGATVFLFHLGNAAMLPLLGQSLVAQGAGDASAYTSATVIVAQLTMIPMALWAARLAGRHGYWIVFTIALAALPVRGLVAAFITGPAGLLPVQMLDGVGAGMLGVAVPGLVARILAGTGHVNAGFGAILALHALGAALSATVGGYAAQWFGYDVSFLVLGGCAAIALLLWIATAPLTREACARPDDDASALAAAKA
jgi:MFS family permease